MTYAVTITSQGQISIPAPFRRILGLNKNTRALVSLRKNQLVIEPVKDIFDLAGTFKTNKKFSQKAIDEGFAEYLGKQGASGL